METLLSLSKLKNAINEEDVTSQRINSFFDGATSKLNKEQIKKMLSIIKNDYENNINFIESLITE